MANWFVKAIQRAVPNRVEDAIGKTAYFLGAPQMAEDAYWSVTNPLDRLAGRGRAADGQMAFPGGSGALARRLMQNANRGVNITDIGINRFHAAATKGRHRAKMVDVAPTDMEGVGNRLTFLISPDGRRILVGPQGAHHGNVANTAGVPSMKGWSQGEVFYPDASLGTSGKLYPAGGASAYQGAQFNERQALALARLLKRSKALR